jgi:hypothetical protein
LASIFSLANLSYSANISASFNILSISSCESLPLSFVITIFSDFPAALSVAVTYNILLASTSNVTSIYGTPLGAGGIPVRSNLPSK